MVAAVDGDIDWPFALPPDGGKGIFSPSTLRLILADHADSGQWENCSVQEGQKLEKWYSNYVRLKR